MILLLAALASVHPVAVEVAGMDAQLKTIREMTVAKGWPITCEGREGEQKVLRINIPEGTYQGEFDGVGIPANWMAFFYRGDPLPETCDHDPSRIAAPSNDKASTLAIGPAGLLEQLAVAARACGFAKAEVRARVEDDFPVPLKHARPEWQTLDAGENILLRDGPLGCFVQLRREVMSRATTDSRP